MADLIFYSNIFPQFQEYALISVEVLEEVIKTGLPLGQKNITRSKKKQFKDNLPMLRVILAAIKENRFVGPNWMSIFELEMVHFPERGIPNLPEPPSFSSEISEDSLNLSDSMQVEEFVPEDFFMVPLAQSTPRHESFGEETPMNISYADTTIEDSVMIMMNDTIISIPSSPQSFGQEVLRFSFNSGYSCHRSLLLSPTSPQVEWVDKTIEIQAAE